VLSAYPAGAGLGAGTVLSCAVMPVIRGSSQP